MHLFLFLFILYAYHDPTLMSLVLPILKEFDRLLNLALLQVLHFDGLEEKVI